MKLIAWLLSMILAFSLGAGMNDHTGTETDDELKNKVQQHIDVIVDESAAIVDDITEEIRKDDRVREAEQFVKDAEEIIQETADEVQQVVDNTKDRIEEKFGDGKQEEAGTAEEPAETTAEPEAPVAGEPVNG